ncbi:co-chaperone YbbN, partial [Mesorhizobium sp. M2E.F.Ca.ET.219.01.1.1]
MSDNNPFGGAFGSNGGQYATTVQFGGTEPGKPPAAAPADVIKDTTTATFAADVIQESRRQPVLVDF